MKKLTQRLFALLNSIPIDKHLHFHYGSQLWIVFFPVMVALFSKQLYVWHSGVIALAGVFLAAVLKEILSKSKADNKDIAVTVLGGAYVCAVVLSAIYLIVRFNSHVEL